MIRALAAGFLIALVGLQAGCITTVEGTIQQPATVEERLKAQLNLARGYLGQGNLASARKPLEKALDIDSRSSEAHVLYAILLQGQSEFEKAEREYRLALRYDRNNAQVLNNYGSFLYSRNRAEEALKYLEAAVKDDSYPGRAQAFENLGLTQLKLEDSASAENSFRRSLHLNSSQYRSMLELASLYFSQGQTDLALDYYDNYLQLARQTPRSLWLGIQLSRSKGFQDRTASYSLALRNLYPNSAEYRLFQDSVK